MNETNIKMLPALASQMISPFEDKDYQKHFELGLNNDFTKYETKAVELMELSAKISINNAEELDIAKSRLLDLKSWINMLDESHKKIKSPLLTLTKLLDGKKKKINDSYEASRTAIITKITFWETIAKRQEQDRLVEELRKKKEIDDLILADTQKIQRMVSNVKALLYGGELVNSAGSTQRKGCFTIPEVEKVEVIISKSLPGPATYRTECQVAYAEAITLISEMVNARKKSLLSTDGTVLSGEEVNILSESSSIINNQEHRINTVDKQFERQIAQTDKGFRREIVYDVFDLSRVPREFLCIDTTKMNDYKVTHRDRILEDLKSGVENGHSFIEGIRFRVEQTSIIR